MGISWSKRYASDKINRITYEEVINGEDATATSNDLYNTEGESGSTVGARAS